MSPTAEYRVVYEHSLSSFAGSTILSATVSGVIQVNNPLNVGVRQFKFGIYSGNGVGDLSDFQIPVTSIGSASYSPAKQGPLAYSIDATAVVQSVLAGGSTWIGLRIQSITDPNPANFLDFTTARLSIVASSSPAIPYCDGVGFTACPCANSGLPDRGCANSVFPGARV
jgi:hypothetical protein